jgi:hypothetical protein
MGTILPCASNQAHLRELLCHILPYNPSTARNPGSRLSSSVGHLFSLIWVGRSKVDSPQSGLPQIEQLLKVKGDRFEECRQYYDLFWKPAENEPDKGADVSNLLDSQSL